jgi:hypothetical protein
MIQRSRSAHGGIGWTASVSADVSHFSVLPAPARQGHLLGVHEQRAGELKRKAVGGYPKNSDNYPNTSKSSQHVQGQS